MRQPIVALSTYVTGARSIRTLRCPAATSEETASENSPSIGYITRVSATRTIETAPCCSVVRFIDRLQNDIDRCPRPRRGAHHLRQASGPDAPARSGRD